MEILMILGDFRLEKTNPIKANMPAIGRKSEILSPKSETDRMEAEIEIPARFTECDLKKQSQFNGRVNWRKLLFERNIWQITDLRSRRKQTQSNPILFSPQIFWGL